MKKGFTLIELLAVIVILSVITLITVPMVMNVIEDSKRKAAVESVNGILDAADKYLIGTIVSGKPMSEKIMHIIQDLMEPMDVQHVMARRQHPKQME